VNHPSAVMYTVLWLFVCALGGGRGGEEDSQDTRITRTHKHTHTHADTPTLHSPVDTKFLSTDDDICDKATAGIPRLCGVCVFVCVCVLLLCVRCCMRVSVCG